MLIGFKKLMLFHALLQRIKYMLKAAATALVTDTVYAPYLLSGLRILEVVHTHKKSVSAKGL